jgi:hypothetical protein
MELSGTHSSLLLPIFNAAELMPWPVTPPKPGAAYQDFLTLWKHADPDIPILIQAKAEYANLR